MARPKKTHADKCRVLLSGVKFPEFNYFDYNASLGQNFKVYNEVMDYSARRKATLLLWESQGKDVSQVSRLKKIWFTTIGAVSHMVLARGIDLHESDMQFIEKKYKEFCVKASKLPVDLDESEKEGEKDNES